MSGDRFISGVDEVKRIIGQIPPEGAQRLQFVMRRNFIDHGEEIARSSTFKSFTSRQIFGMNRSLVRAWPRTFKRRVRISDCKAGIESYWRGMGSQKGDETGARIEKRVGRMSIRPTRSRLLVIPQGDMLTKTGKPRRVAQGGSLQKVAVRPIGGHTPMATSQNRRVGHKSVPILQSGMLENTKWIKTRRGKILLIQILQAGQRGKNEGAHRVAGPKVRATRLGERSRVLAIGKRQARQSQPLDFFGSWDRQRQKREARYDRMLDDVVRGRKGPVQ